MPYSDTLQIFIRDYQESKKNMLNVEHRLMLQVGMGGGRGWMRMSERVGWSE